MSTSTRTRVVILLCLHVLSWDGLCDCRTGPRLASVTRYHVMRILPSHLVWSVAESKFGELWIRITPRLGPDARHLSSAHPPHR